MLAILLLPRDDRESSTPEDDLDPNREDVFPMDMGDHPGEQQQKKRSGTTEGENGQNDSAHLARAHRLLSGLVSALSLLQAQTLTHLLHQPVTRSRSLQIEKMCVFEVDWCEQGLD
jgi:hypothetical protein